MLGFVIGIAVGMILFGVRDLFDTTTTEVTLEADDGLFDSDEQINIPDEIAEGKKDAELFAEFPVSDLK